MDVAVVKIGGSLQGKHLETIAHLTRTLALENYHLVLVHGGGPRISQVLQAENLQMPWYEGQRVTSAQAMDVVKRVLCHEINRELVEDLSSLDVSAKGLCGGEGIILAKPLPGLDRTGDVRKVNTVQLEAVLEQWGTPVLAPIGQDGKGGYCNINADLSAASVAGALKARRVLFLTDVNGIYYDFNRKLRLEDTTLPVLKHFLEQNAFGEGMIPKARAVIRSLESGVEAAFVLNGSDSEAVLAAAMEPLTHSWMSSGGTRVKPKLEGESIEYAWH